MNRPTSTRPFLALLALGLAAGLAPAQDRRGATSPGLVLETGARHATCDVLTFTPDGKQLLACGDDKVVRTWPVGADSFTEKRSGVIRWPIFREQRGSIFALALSPDAKRIAVGGFGVKTGLVVVLNREARAVEHALPEVTSPGTIWAISFTPDGKRVVYGTEHGEVFVWDFTGKAQKATLFARSAGTKRNMVRLIAFLDNRRFISVAEDGKVMLRDVRNPSSAPRQIGRFELPSLYNVVISPDKDWLAACGQNVSGGKADVKRVELLSLRGGKRRFLSLPQSPGSIRFPHRLAFSTRGTRLAVGARVVPDQQQGQFFFKETGGLVFVFEMASGQRVQGLSLNVKYRPDALVFRPGHKDQLATAGGNNHEVRLWRLDGKGTVLDTIRSPGNCLWGVAWSKNGQYFAWRQKRAANPAHPNEWGASAWRVFDLKARKIRRKPPADFSPVLPINTLEGWRVQTTRNAYVWRVIGPGGTDVPLDEKHGLYDPGKNNPPRCYTFLPPVKGKPVRLAVGHTFGLSVYECRPGKVRLARVLAGHEGEVMAVAPSADGHLLVSAGRDQTVCGWGLDDWPNEGELGASFGRSKSGELEVKATAAGSPAWEAGLIEGDDIVMLWIKSEGFLYDPGNRGLSRYGFVGQVKQKGNLEAALKKLRNVKPNREMIFVWKRGKEEMKELTTVRQRPLWRFFPTRTSQGGDWVIWRWRDFFYDTRSVHADRYVGWHVNPARLDRTPRFYRLERFRGNDALKRVGGSATGFHRPDKIWPFLRKAFQNPQRVLFPDIEPPNVEVSVAQKPDGNRNLILEVSIRPRNQGAKQKLAHVALWLDDYRYPKPPKANGGVVKQKVEIPRSQLRRGSNRVTVLGYNVQGGRGQASVTVDYSPAKVAPRTLYGVCVGVNDYTKAKGQVPDLRLAVPDARAMAAMLRKQQGGKVFQKADVTLLEDSRATAKAILGRLQALQGQVKPDDWLVLFLAGHGDSQPDRKRGDYAPGSFYYVCADHDPKRASSKLTSQALYDALAGLRCRKLVVLDACHSGAILSDPLRDLTRDGVPLLVLSACKPDQKSLEPAGKSAGRHGLFTQCLLEVAGSLPAPGGPKQQTVTAATIQNYTTQRMARLLTSLGQQPQAQTPVFYPRTLPRVAVFSRR